MDEFLADRALVHQPEVAALALGSVAAKKSPGLMTLQGRSFGGTWGVAVLRMIVIIYSLISDTTKLAVARHVVSPENTNRAFIFICPLLNSDCH